ncbi:MAG: 7-cyano-7-deazaguanine synthase, partial [Candidatus Altiarchaeales archaeon]|nr:7-cyano-7-deazaguanine synthase [Candidatus Altiarchaeales archaeon]
MEGKHKRLREIISGKRGAVVAFSGGVDSSVVARVAKDMLGGDSVAVTINSVVLSRVDLVNARKVADEIGIKHRVVEYDILKDEDFAKNSGDRCYFCRRDFSGIL